MADVRSLTGSNLRSILVNTGVQVLPGVTLAAAVKKHTLCKVPDMEKWKIPLLHSLLAVKADKFEILFDDEDQEAEEINIGREILENICCN